MVNGFDLDAWLARLDAYRDVPFMPEGCEQPPMPEPENIFDDEEPGGDGPQSDMSDEGRS